MAQGHIVVIVSKLVFSAHSIYMRVCVCPVYKCQCESVLTAEIRVGVAPIIGTVYRYSCIHYTPALGVHRGFKGHHSQIHHTRAEGWDEATIP